MSGLDMQRLWRRIQHMVKPARTSAPAVEKGPVQRVQVRPTPYETHELTSVQHYGFASSPPVGTDMVVIGVAGDAANAITVASNHQTHRPRNMVAGEVRFYDNSGTYIRLKDGEVTVVAPTKVTFSIPVVEMSGKLTVAGDISTTGGDVKAGTITLKTHKHLNTQPGTGRSGTPTA